jgi:hypothetical protein
MAISIPAREIIGPDWKALVVSRHNDTLAMFHAISLVTKDKIFVELWKDFDEAFHLRLGGKYPTSRSNVHIHRQKATETSKAYIEVTRPNKSLPSIVITAT